MVKLFKNIRVLDPSQELDRVSDVLIEEGRIAAIDLPGKIPTTKAQVLDSQGLWLLPGLIDMHVHLREPGMEHKETIASGTQGAIAGGFTVVACMANTSPVNDRPLITKMILESAAQNAKCRVYPIGAVSKGLKGEELAEIGGMAKAGVVALSDDGMPVMNAYLMRKAMDYAKAFGLTIISHAEDLNLVGKGVMNEGALSSKLGLRGNPTAAEEIMVAREIALCRLTRCPTHIAHLTSELGLMHVRRAKEEGLPITAEVTPHHLSLTEDRLKLYDTDCKMAPPLRTTKDVAALRKGLSDGTIDCLATDHAPHAVVDKLVEFDQAAFGIIGVETAIPVTLDLIHQGGCSPLRWAEAWTTRPAKILKLDTPSLRKGAPANLTVIDPSAKWKFEKRDIHSKSRNTPYLGADFQGKTVATWIAGKEVYAR